VARANSEKPNRDDASNLTVRLLRPHDWPEIEKLFGPRGACGGCWCMWWRVPRGGKLWAEMKGKKNRAAFRKLVQNGDVHGVLAYSGDEAVGWCSFGPRRSHARLETVRALRRDWSQGTWSILCFYIPPLWRRRASPDASWRKRQPGHSSSERARSKGIPSRRRMAPARCRRLSRGPAFRHCSKQPATVNYPDNRGTDASSSRGLGPLRRNQACEAARRKKSRARSKRSLQVILALNRPLTSCAALWGENAGDRGRTCTPKKGNRTLNPARLPIPPRPRER
jgi:hypothetical protein